MTTGRFEGKVVLITGGASGLVEAAVEQDCGRLDVLFNNAGVRGC